VSFTNFENLEGVFGKDTFVFPTAWVLPGPSRAATAQYHDYSQYSNPVVVDLGDGLAPSIAAFSNIQNVVGGASNNDSLLGPDADSTWSITGTNSGEAENVHFSSFENLIGSRTLMTGSFLCRRQFGQRHRRWGRRF
jgi:hypothetical protein